MPRHLDFSNASTPISTLVNRIKKTNKKLFNACQTLEMLESRTFLSGTAPHATDDPRTTAEDTALVVTAPGLLANDTDVDGDPLTAVVNAQPTHGILALNDDGSFTYTPALNYNGADSFTYHANDGTSDSNIATVAITVTAVNDAPVTTNDLLQTPVNAPLTVVAPGVLANDTDVDGNSLTSVLVLGPSHGTITFGADGSLTYTPTAAFHGTDSFTYKSNDGTVDGNTVAVTIHVNTPPVGVADTGTTAEDTPLVVVAPGILTNDTDTDTDALTAVLVAGPIHGTLTLNADGSYTYTPALNYNGADSFTYKANDGFDDGNTTTVSLTVTAVNDAPVTVADSLDTPVNGPLTVNLPGLLSNDTDIESNPLTAVLVSTTTHGTLTLFANGSLSYSPDLNFHGTDSFTYKSNDGTADGNTATVTIHVNTAPVGNTDTYSTAEDTALVVPVTGVLANDTDANTDALTAVLIAGPTHGLLTLNANGSFTYTPNADFHGSDSFTYAANDTIQNSNTATVNITVTSVNDLPVSVDDVYTTPEDTALVVPVGTGVLANDTDADTGDTLTATVVATTTHGTLTLNANGSFTYTPNANFNGTDTFTYKVNDGTADGNTATVTITVSAVQDIPVAVNDSETTAEDTPLTVVAPGLLSNDTDADGDTLTSVVVVGPTHGNVTLNTDGSYTYTPNANFNGTDTFTYKANDGTADSNTATVTITVTPVNDLPVAGNDLFHTGVNAPLIFPAPGVITNDADTDGDTLTAAVVVGPTHGTLTLNADGSFTYTSNADFNGTDTFTYKVNDGTGDSNIATATIKVNTLSVGVDDTYTTPQNNTKVVTAPGVLANDTDADTAGAGLTAVLVAGPAHGTLTLNVDGSFTYTPTNGFSGADTFTYKPNDGIDDGSTATVTITVGGPNTSPVATDDAYTVHTGNALSTATPGVLGNDTDAESNPLTAAVVAAPAHGTLTLNADGSFTYTPGNGFSGSDSFTYKANDGTSDSNVATVTLTVSPNSAPVAVNDAYTTVQDTALVQAVPGVLANDTDADSGDSHTATVAIGPLNGTLTLNANGSFTYTPNAGFKGVDIFSYATSDGTATSNVATVTITVTPATPPTNHNPVASSFTVTRNPGSTAPVDVLANATDADSDPLGISIATAPANGIAVINNNNTPFNFADDSILYIPNSDYFGNDSFTVTVSDNRGGTSTATVTVQARTIGLSPNPSNPSKNDLIVIGTSGKDTIKLAQSGASSVKVTVNGHNKGTFNVTGRVIADGLGGNDIITAAGLKKSVILYGGDGNDVLTGSTKASQLFGGAGNDTLNSNTGRDLLSDDSGSNVFN